MIIHADNVDNEDSDNYDELSEQGYISLPKHYQNSDAL